MIKYWAFRALAIIVPLIPYAIAQRLAYLTGWAMWAVAGTLRERAEWNLAHVPTLKDDPEALRRASRGVFVHLIWNYLDFLRGRHLKNEQILDGWTDRGEEDLRAIMAQGKGCVFFTGHFGNFELGATRLGAVGFPVTTLAERLKPEPLFQLVVKLREHHEMHFLPVDARASLIEIRRALKRNEILCFAVDRHVAGAKTAELEFFGEPATFAIAPAAIGLSAGATLGVAYSWRLGFGRWYGEFVPLDITLQPGESVDEGAIRVQRAFLRHMEERIIAHPEQWVSAVTRVWKREQRQLAETSKKQVPIG